MKNRRNRKQLRDLIPLIGMGWLAWYFVRSFSARAETVSEPEPATPQYTDNFTGFSPFF